MPKVRYLRVRFNQDIAAYDIPRFRAAVIEKTERVASLFHNHQPTTGFIYRYPLIQYKVTRQKATIVCLEAGTDDIHHLLQHRDMNLRIGTSQQCFDIEDIQLRYHQVQLWEHTFQYHIRHWLALNQYHYEQWQHLMGYEEDQKKMLEAILRGNILAFAKGIDWFIEGEVKLKINAIRHRKTMRFKNNEMLGLSVDFETNVSLPEGVGLGKGVSVGFGMVGRRNENGQYSRG